MRTVLEPRLVDATAFEPGLVVDVRDEKRALLVDLGPPLQSLPPRVLLRVSRAFVTHTHMDHFAGFDHLLALRLGRVRQLTLWGGPGFCEQVGHKLAAYTWNVVHRYELPMTIDAHAVEADGSHRHARYESLHRFACTAQTADGARAAADGVHLLLDDPLLQVRATLVDHEMPVLAFAFDETAQWRVAADRVAAMGLTTGPWLRALKAALREGAGDDTPIDLAWRDADGEHAERRRVGELRPLVLDAVPGRRIGYVTDLRYTRDNVERLEALLAGCDLLHIEAVFADADRDQALRKNHLTAPQAGEIARRVGAKAVVPFHFSPRYRGHEAGLRDELEHARRQGGPAPP